MSSKDFNFETFIKDRDEALLSLDPAKIRAYATKYGEKCPADDEVVIAGAHKAITALLSAPDDVRQKSRDWLSARGLSSLG